MTITPGPWQAESKESVIRRGQGSKTSFARETREDGFLVETANGGHRHLAFVRNKADARAIAEVPSMIAYLEKHQDDPEAAAILRRTGKAEDLREDNKMDERFQDTDALSFHNETIIITDPCYIAHKHDDDWEKCGYGEDMGSLGLKNFLVHSTIYGDWSCTVFERGTNKELGTFCADAGLVGVFSLAEVLKYNPDFDYHKERPWTTATIENFSGEVSIVVERNGDSGAPEVSVVGRGSVNFYSVQTGF